MWASLCLLVPATIVYMFRNEMYIKYADACAAALEAKLKQQSVNKTLQPIVEESSVNKTLQQPAVVGESVVDFVV